MRPSGWLAAAAIALVLFAIAGFFIWLGLTIRAQATEGQEGIGLLCIFAGVLVAVAGVAALVAQWSQSRVADPRRR